MTDAERYQQILDKYTPPGVVFVPVEDTDDGHRGMAYVEEEYDEEGNELPCRLEAPAPPDSLGRLWVCLHECAHRQLWHRPRVDTNEYSRCEAEANLEVMRIFDEEGLVAPVDVLEEELQAFLPHVLADDRRWERHPTVIRCLEEFDRRIKAAARNF
jgi:hypothetical protein